MSETKKQTALTTPILFIVFKRLDTTQLVFDAIRKAQPTKLYIAADGPRNTEEKTKTDALLILIRVSLGYISLSIHCQ